MKIRNICNLGVHTDVVNGKFSRPDQQRGGVFALSKLKEPMFQEPMFQEQMFQEPMFQEPMFQEPMFQEPMCQELMFNVRW